MRRDPRQPTATPNGIELLSRCHGKGSFGAGNPLGANIGAPEVATAGLVNGVAQKAPVALGLDHNGDGKGTGFNVPSLLGINAVPPYMHNGACETLACVVSDMKHRTANGKRPDGAATAQAQALIVEYLRSIDAATPPLTATP